MIMYKRVQWLCQWDRQDSAWRLFVASTNFRANIRLRVRVLVFLRTNFSLWHARVISTKFVAGEFTAPWSVGDVERLARWCCRAGVERCSDCSENIATVTNTRWVPFWVLKFIHQCTSHEVKLIYYYVCPKYPQTIVYALFLVWQLPDETSFHLNVARPALLPNSVRS